MLRRLVFPVLLAALALFATPAAQSPAPAPVRPVTGDAPSVLATLRPAHPRLMVLDDDVSRLRVRLASNVRLREWRDRLQLEAARMLDQPPVERTLDGPRLLEQSRAALHRISTLAGLYLIDRDPRKLARAKTEMLAAAAFSDWNPAHFLDVAEMTTALAIGYDWLFPDLTPEERATIRAAIVAKGLEPGVRAIQSRTFWAAEGRDTWTDVCFAGLTLGALAVAEDKPAVADAVLAALRGPVVTAHFGRYAPDGSDIGGLGYWSYSTRYLSFLLSSLQTSLGTDFGLGSLAGVQDIGRFRMFSIGPSLRQFNYADAGEQPEPAPQMLWLATRFDKPEYAAHERAWIARAKAAPSIFHLLWSAAPSSREATAPSPAAKFRGIELAVLGGDWRDPMSSWVAVKGGNNAAGLGHLDLGSFVLDAHGERWAVDLGPDYYSLPEYFGRLRSSYFRVRTESHNTLLAGNANQDTAATAPIVAFSDDSYRSFAVVDLSAAYRPGVSAARRGIALVDGRDVLIQDEVEGAGDTDVAWQMATRARVGVAGNDVVLWQNGRSALLRVIEPAGAAIRVDPAVAPAPQIAQPDVSMIRVMAPSRQPALRFVVWFSTGRRQPPSVAPLSEWPEIKAFNDRTADRSAPDETDASGSTKARSSARPASGGGAQRPAGAGTRPRPKR